MRTEHDMLGTRSLSDHTLYGLQTLRARENFITSYHTTNLALIYAMVQVKKAAALSYRELYPKEAQKWDAICCACDRILAGDVDDSFCTSALQGGAGTSTNMNVNEVIANLALTVLGQALGNYDTIHPLDDVNRGQSFRKFRTTP
ncbi:MAG: lyase family protein [Lachnospiraceae bacterium]